MICLLFISTVDWDISDYYREYGILGVHPNTKQATTTCFQSQQDAGLPAVYDDGDPFGWLLFCLSD